ncbi:hypothetical protein BC829DRAFT_406109 [Chytridium lagenaria]|nr:hypothetical protein BC829DRAFT_406109 [Chytridium lagenaria]
MRASSQSSTTSPNMLCTSSHLPAPNSSSTLCAASASFLVSDPVDRDELASRLVFSSRGPEAAALVFPSDNDTTVFITTTAAAASSSSSSTSFQDDHSSIDTHENVSATVHTIANFLLRNDTDREELVEMLRIQAARADSMGAVQRAQRANDEDMKKTNSSSSSSSKPMNVYGMDDRDMFNQLVMLETPALATAPFLSKL